VGCDCAGLPMRVYQSVGLVPADYSLPPYSPQQWLKRDFEDTTYLNEIKKFSLEITEAELQPGDMVLYRLVRSYTHGAICIQWPSQLIHAVVSLGVIYADARTDRLMSRTPHLCFSFVRKALGN
jgi:cell wall-associated NlpC family hydrolase